MALRRKVRPGTGEVPRASGERLTRHDLAAASPGAGKNEAFRTIVESLGDAVFLSVFEQGAAPTGRLVVVNDRACRHLGYTREELLSLPPSQVLGDAFNPSLLDTLRSGGEVHFEATHVRRDGSRVPVEVYARTVDHAGEAAVLCVARDVAERKRAEEDRRRRAQGLATLVEASRSLAATLDLATVLQATTDGATRLFGLDTAAIYLVEGDEARLWATTPPLPSGFPEELRKARLADHPHLRRAITSGKPMLVPDVATATLTAMERSVAEQRNLRSLLFVPLVAQVKPEGALIVGSVGTPRAIGEPESDLCLTLANLGALAVENARLYEASRQHGAALERAMAARDRAEQQRLELERQMLHAQKLESLGVLAGGVAHDFNNLLMAILGNLDLALLELAPASPARVRVEQSIQATRRGSELARQLLAYSGKGRFVVEAVDLSRLVEENARLFDTSVSGNATLRLDLDRSLPLIEAAPGQVQQVVMNLITNAAEAIGPEGGTITVTTGLCDCDARYLARSRLREVPPAGRFAFVETSDTGCGMDELAMDRLFDPFYSTKSPGRGLGMAAIQGIVRGHRGAILVDSALGRGSTVRVLFPVLEGSRHEAAAVPAEGQAPLLRGTVLVVDDQELVREACLGMVEALGMDALAAADGHEALEVLRREADRISHVLLDLSMPGMDGITAFQELVRIKPGVKVILSSGYDEQGFVRRLAGRGPAGFIQKPYSVSDLRAVLEKASRTPE
ncbi:MAG TPA: response regulator [Vicinamibacteria bacterium]